ncbi:hypothetical protein NEIRO03_1808 [Nematocida sp. AWRm78]|nr:hypothetical protein NEIRO02_1831 [Nematocida sp. AWRm79]KAI5184680.1 hypothetical protein NEIRO03_1808 [Nematocida sp. AWRm78]
MAEDAFLRADFSLDEYLSRILADSSGECSRLKDQHVRILSQHADSLSCEIIGEKEKIYEGLNTLSALVAEAKRISSELPELFLPLLSGETSKLDSELHRDLENEVEAMQGDLSIAEGRTLQHKEHITLVIDRQVYTGIILVCKDIIIVGLNTQEGREMYNALLIKEIQCSIEGSSLIISLPPIRIEITKTESTLKHLLNKITGREASKPKKSSKTKEPKSETTSEISINEVDGIEYKKYLLQIGRIESIESPSNDEIIKEILAMHKASQWKGTASLLKILKKKSILDAVKIYCQIEGEIIEKAIDSVISKKAPITSIIERVHTLLDHYIKGIEKVFPESAAYGYIAVHLEDIHVNTAKHMFRLFYMCSDSLDENNDSHSFITSLKKAFTYNGYSYGYTVRVGDDVLKDILKSKYGFNKQVMQSVFKQMQK